MTACAPPNAPAPPAAPPTVGLPRGTEPTVSACGGYAARLVDRGEGWFPERWTLDGPEPYAVPLPGGRPEDPASEVVPLADGRVLIARRTADRWDCCLLYPSGPRTGEQPLGAVDGTRLRLLPPAPDGRRVFALLTERPGADGEPVTALWRLCGGAAGPELVCRLAGGCAGGAWLDEEGRLLALNRTDARGRARAVAVDVVAGGEPGVLLQIGERSNDRLLLADPDSGLLLVSSDAPGEPRIGWGVLGSARPVRFPEALHAPARGGPAWRYVSPLSVQPGQTLLPESCGVALRATGPDGEWLAVWRPQQRELQHFPAPEGWLPEATRWTADGRVLLPYATSGTPCGLVRLEVPVPAPRPLRPGRAVLPEQQREGARRAARPAGAPPRPVPPRPGGAVAAAAAGGRPAGAAGTCTPVPLQQAPLG